MVRPKVRRNSIAAHIHRIHWRQRRSDISGVKHPIIIVSLLLLFLLFLFFVKWPHICLLSDNAHLLPIRRKFPTLPLPLNPSDPKPLRPFSPTAPPVLPTAPELVTS